MNVITIRYRDEIYIINRDNVNYINIKPDYIIKDRDVLLTITLNNGSVILRFSSTDSALFLANKIMNGNENEITV